MIFPRYHQLDVVNYLTNETKNNETGKNYLVEHSTGSGKSNSIAWMAYKLFSLHDGSDPVFDSIIVLSDRIGIVDQLAKTVEQFQKKSGTTKEMESTKELVENLENYRRILITTQQKFPPALKKIEENKGKIKGKKFAILIDEAHSSQTGEDAKRVKELLTKNLEEAEKIDSEDEEKSKDLVDELEEHVISHGNIPTLNYYAFTATPKWKTLKLFGRLVLDENGNPIIDKKTGNQTYVAHHKYTMNQAIEEGFILDVLKDYTAYEQIFQLVQLSKDKIVETKKALVSLLKFVNSHEKSIREKSEVIVDDFEENVKDQINGKAKAMVVTSSRLHAVRFKQTIDEIIKERGYTGINTLVAFSGTVKQNGDSFTQSNMTKMTEKQLVESFDSDDYNILIVAEKYQTGFDQPLLHTMYVDKYLKGIKAVQTLSRLNRAYKDKNSTHVIDFRNDPKLIQRAYEGFYYGASLIDDLKPEFLEKLYSDIFSPGVFTIDDIEKFWDIFSKTPAEQIKSDAPALDGIISAPRSSYDAIEDEKIQEKFRLDIRKYHEVYSFMTNLFSFSDLKYEKLFAIIKYCLKTRKFPGFSLITDIQNDVTLASYKLKLSSSGSISLGPAKATHGINGTSSTKEPEVLTSLSEVIKRLNEKFGKGEATPADILAYTELLDFLNTSEKLKNIAKVNPLPDFLRHLKDNFNDYLLNSEISRTNEKLVVTLLEKTAYRDEVIEFIGTIFHSGAKESFIPAISSDNPAENKLRFRQAIESCDGFIKWEDRYLDAEGLEYLEVINKEKVKKIQLLTSVYHWGVNEKLLEKFKELKQNLEKHGISCEMQVIMTKDLHRKMHDRYILSENLKYNVPSPTQVKFGQYSEIKITNADVPFDEWWNDSESIDIIQNWDKVKAKREQLSRRY